MMKRFFKYIENLWIGMDGKPSLKSVLAIAFSYNFLKDTYYAIHRWDGTKSLSDLALILGIEAGLITALLGLKVYANNQQNILDSKDSNKDDKAEKCGPID